MELKDQVCSLELAKKLKELGVKQESIRVYDEGRQRVIFTPDGERRPQDIAVFTVAELGEMLKCTFHVDQPKAGFLKMDATDWVTWINHPDKKLQQIKSGTEADARAKMLIYLIENKLLTA